MHVVGSGMHSAKARLCLEVRSGTVSSRGCVVGSGTRMVRALSERSTGGGGRKDWDFILWLPGDVSDHPNLFKCHFLQTVTCRLMFCLLEKIRINSTSTKKTSRL